MVAVKSRRGEIGEGGGGDGEVEDKD